MKDHEIAALVNELTIIARQYHDAQQLREQIAHAVVPAIRKSRREVLLEAADWFDNSPYHGFNAVGTTESEELRRMAEELK